MIEKSLHWLLLALTAAYILTGLGITDYHTIEYFTFGLLTKNLSFNIHEGLLWPFVVVLVMHVMIKPLKRVLVRRRAPLVSN